LLKDTFKQPVSETWRLIKLRMAEYWLLGKQLLADFSLTGQSHNNLIGLQIIAECIKLLKINTTEKGYEVEYFSITPLPPGVVVKEEIKDSAAVARILQDVVRQSGLSTKNIALAIPRSSAIIKNFLVSNKLTKDEIESRVWIEANRLFPNLIDDIYLDFVVLGKASDGSPQKEVMLVACRKGQVNPYLEIIRSAGLHIKVVDVNCYAFERALGLIAKESPQLKTIALLNLSYTLSTLIVIHEGNLIYTYELNYDGRSVMPKNQANGISDEMLKNTLGLHLRHTMQYFYSSRPNIAIQKMFLSGVCAAEIPRFAEFIAGEIGIEAVLANPFVKMTLAPSVDNANLQKQAPSLVQCCGLALSKNHYE